MTELQERDAMICRNCGHEERASEGYPCKDCGTFICLMCVFKGVVRCERCAAISAVAEATPGGALHDSAAPDPDWPEH